MTVTAVPFTHKFTRSEYFAIAAALDPAMRHELLNGTIYTVSPAKAPHAGVVTYLVNRLRVLASTHLLRVQDVLEIEPEGAPEPNVAIVRYRDDYYKAHHPSGGDALLVVEVGDSERNPREKMREYMRDGRIAAAWRIDIPHRCVELWAPQFALEPTAIVRGSETFAFENVTFVAEDVFAGLAVPPSPGAP